MKRCDCANPDCTLPPGRCYLCGAPTEKANGTPDDDRVELTVGPCCYPEVVELAMLEAEERDADVEPAWMLMNGDGATFAEIQTNDERGVFDGDVDAAEHVAQMLGVVPVYPEGA